MNGRPLEILIVEDNPVDVLITKEALKETKVATNISVMGDGVEAMAFLNAEGKYSDRPIPDLILLDLNLPKRDGREVLAEIKRDPDLRRIPVLVLTTSKADEDVVHSYELHANCVITKPVDLDKFVSVIKSIDGFWLNIVRLPEEKI
jgi:CheY-like chemotaxis protein